MKKAKWTVSYHPVEREESITLAQYLDARGFLWCHVPNEIAESKEEGRRLKMCGLKKGVPDILIFYPVNIAIELKRRVGGTVSPAQYAWIQNLNRVGWDASVCFGAQDAIDFVKQCVSRRSKRKEVKRNLFFGKSSDGVTRLMFGDAEIGRGDCIGSLNEC